MNTHVDPATVPTRYWHTLDDGRVQCVLCPRFCKLHERQRGFCFVRACQGGQVVLTIFGRPSGFGVDPIEKKPLEHFLPGRHGRLQPRLPLLPGLGHQQVPRE